MDFTAKLNALGFVNVEAIPDNKRRGVTVYKIRTALGWCYERFEGEADVDAWAASNRPE